MFERLIRNQYGLALLGSLLLVSMLAVLSTAFLLVMAADVRISQSHFHNTQAYYHAESAAEVVAYKLSSDPSIQALALSLPRDFLFGPPASGTTVLIQYWSSGSDSFDVSLAYPVDYPSHRRLLWVRGFSGRASIDIYQDVLLPTQDPRTFYTIVAGSKLELKDECRVEGGGGVWISGSTPWVEVDFVFESPSASDPLLMVRGPISWGDDSDEIDPFWNGVLDIQAAPVLMDIVPQVLLFDTPPYQYKVTGDATIYWADELPNPPVGNYGPSGSFGEPNTNPMGIYVWDYLTDERIEQTFTLDGTLYCPKTKRLEFRNCNVTIKPIVYDVPNPKERYPAIVSKGSIHIRGWGIRQFNGLVYCSDRFDSDPLADTCNIIGMLIADDIRLRNRTVVRYDSTMQTQPWAPFAAGVYPTIILHQRRYIHTYSIF